MLTVSEKRDRPCAALVDHLPPNDQYHNTSVLETITTA